MIYYTALNTHDKSMRNNYYTNNYLTVCYLCTKAWSKHIGHMLLFSDTIFTRENPENVVHHVIF